MLVRVMSGGFPTIIETDHVAAIREKPQGMGYRSNPAAGHTTVLMAGGGQLDIDMPFDELALKMTHDGEKALDDE